MSQVKKNTNKKANPTPKLLHNFFKQPLSCPIYLRIMRYHHSYFHYAEYDLAADQTRISEIDELKA